MNYKIYNDYEMLYLIKEGNELAYNIMFLKYEKYIWRLVTDLYSKQTKSEDMVQEGRMVLHSCILGYNSYMGISFFSYFSICLKRKIFKEMKKSYYDDYIHLNDDQIGICYGNNKLLGLEVCLNKEEEELYEWLFIFDRSLTTYTNKKGIPYSEGVKKYKQLLAKVKKNYAL